jgi:hypothetical protein
VIRRSLLTRPLCAAALLALASTPTLAAWPHDPAVNMPVCTAAHGQGVGTIVSDGAGGAIVTWQDFRVGNGTVAIYAQHVLASGTADPAWPVNGRALCAAGNNNYSPTIVADGAGGAIVTWFSYTSILAQHVLASGAVDPAWPVNGRIVSTDPFEDEETPTIVADGAGGAIITWMSYRSGTSYDIYAQHVRASGAVDPAWPTNGRALCIAAGDQYYPNIVTDGAGGAIVTWEDYRGDGDIYAQHVRASGTVDPAWPADGRALCTAANEQVNPVVVADGAGGAIVTWSDARGGNGTDDIYAQHVRTGGGVDPAWPVNGRALCSALADQKNPSIIPDGTGGAIIAWRDGRNLAGYDIYAHHLLASGAADPAWPANGRALCTAADEQSASTIVADGSGGAIVAWQDLRGGSTYDVYAQHVLASGGVDPAWPADGRALSTAADNQSNPKIASDGDAGAIVTWTDARSGVGNDDIYAQRVARFGFLGSPEPTITSVRDVAGDQGGKVRIKWHASFLDTMPTLDISLYGIWHRVSESAALSAVRHGARLVEPNDSRDGITRGSYLVTQNGAQSVYWEGLGTVAADGESTYTFLAMTLQDSTASSNPYSVFMVDAHRAYLPGFWRSVPDSGYSVDNLPPAMPAPFTGQYSAGTVHLHWNPNVEVDLARYRLYRGGSASFVPGPGSLIASPADTGYVDPAGAPYYYKLSAVDIHDNESGFASLLPTGTVSADDARLPGELALARPSPNPASGPVTLRFALPRATRLSLSIYDASGRLVRRLASGPRDAGEYALPWDLHDGRGARVPAGLYFVQLEAEGRAIVRQVTAVR